MRFYATIDCDSVRSYMPDVPYLLPASSWARTGLAPPKLPPQVSHVAADSGGFSATRIHGDYTFTPEAYVTWLSSFAPRWAATFDYCCEDEVTLGRPGLVRERQERTTHMAAHFWTLYRDAPWAWVPTVQGWEIQEYRRHASELRPLVADVHRAGHVAFRVGIGTLCRRANARTIHDVTRAVADELPGVPLHLWGIKLAALRSRVGVPQQVASIDSAAWNGRWGTGIEQSRRSDLSQRRYSYTIALPAYLKKVELALGTPKQLPLPLL